MRARTAALAAGVTTPSGVVASSDARMSLPKLLVRHIIVFYQGNRSSIFRSTPDISDDAFSHLKINLPALAISDTPLIEDLQQDHRNVLVRLFELI